MNAPSPLRSPITLLYQPRAEISPFIRAFVLRDTRDCVLEGDRLLNRFPASSHCVITWLRIRRMGSRITLGMASSMLGIGPRQLQRLALREAGANLQTLIRLKRGERSFLGAQRRHRAGQPPTWAEHAIECDYADQSHMARECKAQTGRTPTQLVRDVQHEEADWIYRLDFCDDQDSPPRIRMTMPSTSPWVPASCAIPRLQRVDLSGLAGR